MKGVSLDINKYLELQTNIYIYLKYLSTDI